MVKWVLGKEGGSIPAIGGKRMAIRPRKMSLVHIFVVLLMRFNLDSGAVQWQRS